MVKIKKKTFKKEERLRSQKQINALFKKGNKFSCYPFLIVYLKNENILNHKVAVSVPKKNFSKAVERNYIKRRLREAYRLNKNILNDNPSFFNIMIIYNEKKYLNWESIENRIIQALQRLQSNHSLKK